MKGQPIEQEKIFVSEVTNKQLISKIYKQLMQLNIKKINNPVKKSAEALNKYFSKEDIQMAKKHVKRCSILLIIREMQTKTITHTSQNGHHQKPTNDKCWRGCG